MKKILIYYHRNTFSMTDFWGTEYDLIPEIVKNQYSGKFPNVGNKVWLQAIVSEITDGSNEYEFGYEDISEDVINEKYDCVLMPLANCFHKGWIPYLKRRASHIRKLKIPVYVIACGIQADSYDDLDELVKDLREPATEFISAVYDTGGEFALRGYFTAEFFEKLGFKNAVVTGCPSLFQMGRDLKITDAKVSKDVFKATINGTFKLPLTDKEIEKCDFIDQGNYGNMMFDPSYFASNPYDFRRIAKMVKRGAVPEISAIAEERIKLYPHTNDWLNYYVCNKVSFSFGSRIHGTVMPILAGVPSLLYSCDARTREMAEFFDIPYITGGENGRVQYNLYDLYQSVSYQKFNDNFSKRFDEFESFLIRCGLVEKINQNNIFMERNADIVLPEIPNQNQFSSIRRKFKMIKPFAGLIKKI